MPPASRAAELLDDAGPIADDAIAWEGEDEARARASAPKSIRFDALRLDGFKSFPDRTELLIEPGMTGIVGPNGCGKSNLLEALRWVMGESSAKNMRGEDMSDLIFAGNDRRPARNVAEVTVTLDNRARRAPPEINGTDRLEVSRRIARGEGGSRYRANGRDTRRGDLVTLFQDSGSGPRSSGLVSQDHVKDLVTAKPSSRRSTLEEAAGVAGLAVRRKGTRARIGDAEEGLARADEMLSASTENLASLRRQAKQAQRRRELDGKVRQAQARVALLRLDRNAAASLVAAERHAANEARVAEAILSVRRAEAAREAAIAALPGLREARSTAEQALARGRARRETLADQAGMARRAMEEADRRIIELGADRQRSDAAIAEARSAAKRLSEERLVIAEQRSEEVDLMEEASDRVEETRAEVERADARVAAAGAAVAGREATAAALGKARDGALAAADAAEARHLGAQGRLSATRAALPDTDLEASLAAEAEVAAEAQEHAETALRDADEALSEARERLAAGVAARDGALATCARLDAEAGGLRAADAGADVRDPVAGSLVVDAGYEAAVAAALGEALGLPAGEGDGLRWTGRSSGVPAGTGGRTLADVARGVAEVSQALAATLLWEGEGLPPPPPFGWQAVTRDGHVHRWDGLAGTPAADRVGGRLRRASRLRAVDVESAAARDASTAAGSALAVAAEAAATAAVREQAARAATRASLERLAAARAASAAFERGAGDKRREAAVAEADARTALDARAATLDALSAAQDALAALPPDAEAQAELSTARRRVADLREAEQRHRLALERLISDSQGRRLRFDAVLREEAEWSRKSVALQAERGELGRRADEAQALRDEMRSLPEASPEAVAQADAEVEDAGAAASAAAVSLDAGERARDDAEAGLRSAEATLSGLRETRVGLLAALEAAKRESEAVAAYVAERLSHPNGEPYPRETISAIACPDEEDAPREVPQAEARLSRLEREREALGQVNLLAEEQLAEQERRHGEHATQREDLRQTIAKLKQGLAEIEAEARTRLQAAFRIIDGNFRDLFTRLFHGGEAHLRLVESDDILEAGLEIYASPPGKRMGAMSLMSGGEKSLTAMALIMAVFQANPAPVCILDEVDAALDDANRDLLCGLVESMAEGDNTRFLVITHATLTMARMDRLYGVTMQERGVSSLTRVDIDKAVAIVEDQ